MDAGGCQHRRGQGPGAKRDLLLLRTGWLCWQLLEGAVLHNEQMLVQAPRHVQLHSGGHNLNEAFRATGSQWASVGIND